MVVAGKLRLEWSPEQISAWLKRSYPQVEEMQISHETIYRSLFVQARGVLKKELVRHLRTRRMMRLSENASPLGQGQGPISDPVSIRERPAEVEDRAVPGDWEGDLLSGSNNTHIATLVERKSRFTLLVKVKNRESQTVVQALTKKIRRLPTELRKSLTWDRGGEMAAHKKFSIATDVQVYFCDPRSPWQRGTNENTNRLLRRYFPMTQPPNLGPRLVLVFSFRGEKSSDAKEPFFRPADRTGLAAGRVRIAGCGAVPEAGD
jgi:IS30 family transposase